MCVAANTHVQKLFSKTENCALWNSIFRYDYMLYIALAKTGTSQWVTRRPSQSLSHQIRGWAHPDQMPDRGRADGARPIAHRRSGSLPQAFVCTQPDSVLSLPPVVVGTLPPPYRVGYYVGKKSEEDDTACGRSNRLAVHRQNRMWGEGCQ